MQRTEDTVGVSNLQNAYIISLCRIDVQAVQFTRVWDMKRLANSPKRADFSVVMLNGNLRLFNR